MMMMMMMMILDDQLDKDSVPCQLHSSAKGSRPSPHASTFCPTVHTALHVHLLGHPGEAPNTSGHPWQASLVRCQPPQTGVGGACVFSDVKEEEGGRRCFFVCLSYWQQGCCL